MATQVQSLFGLTPDVLQSQRNAALNDQAFQFAQMTPMQQAQMGLFRGGSQLGTGLAGLMGYQDPEEMRLKDINDIGSKIQWDKPESIMQAAQEMSTKGYSREAMALMQKAQEAQETAANIAKTNTERQGILTKQQQEEQLRAALAELPENATPEQYLAVVRKFGSPDKIMSSIQTSMDKEEQRKQALELKKMEIERRIEEARIRGEQAQELERIRIEGRRELAQFAAALKASQPAAQRPERTLPASLQKSEDADYEAVDSAAGLAMSLEPVINTLGGFGEKPNKPTLNLSAANNFRNQALNFLGQSTPESREYSQLEETKIRIINESLRLNKGTQTEGDAQRAAREVEAAWARNDTEATRQALLRLYKITERAKKNRETQIDRRRKSQGVAPASNLGTAENPIKLD
jgi:hypothetical protein